MQLWSLAGGCHTYKACSQFIVTQSNRLKIIRSILKSLHRFQFQGMENRLHQRRVSFSDPHSPKHHGSSDSISDKTWNWLPRITSHDDYIRDDEYVTSVAATAFAIHSLEEAELRDLQKMREHPKPSRPQTMRREEDGISKRPSNGETSMKRSRGQDPMTKETAFPVRRPSGTSSPRPVSPAPGYPMQKGIPLPHKNTKTKPETCESALKNMIQKQYKIMKSKILSWEFVKTIQAKVQETRKMQNYRSKVTMEDMGARAVRRQKKRRVRGEKKLNQKSINKQGPCEMFELQFLKGYCCLAWK